MAWLLGGLLWLFTATAWAGSYSADNSVAHATTYPWIDTSPGTGLSLSDEAVSANISLGFTFTFGTTAYTQVRIGSNGLVHFGSTTTTGTTYALPLDGTSFKPNINAVLMPLWDDLDPSAGGSIRYRTTGSSPNRVFTVTWDAVPLYGSGVYVCTAYFIFFCTAGYWDYLTATFQVQIHEQGHIVYRYGNVDGNGGAHSRGGVTNGGATIGLELTNNDLTTYSRDTASISNGTTLLWTRHVNTLVSGQRYSFESHALSGNYIRHFSPLASLSPLTAASSLSSRQDASFIARPGLADSSCWSFESVNTPGWYLRHSGFRLRLDIYSAIAPYPQDATFCERRGLATGSKISLESYNYPAHYIRSLSDLTVGISADDASGTFNGRATFTAASALVDSVYLRAQWDFESITTNTTPDSSGNGNTLTLGATGTALTHGTASYGLSLSGSSPAAGSSTGATLPSTGSYTVAAWVRFNSLTACIAQAVVSQDGTTVHPFAITVVPGCGLPQSLYFQIMATDSDASAVKRVYALASPAANTWMHVAGVYNAATSTMSFYVNCTLQGTETAVTTFSASGPLTVGRSRFSGGARDFLNGVVDGVKVWTGARSASDIATECTNMPRRLIAEYRFDEASWTGSAGAVADQSGNGYNATAAGLSATFPTTATTSPVVSASPGTCAYGSFTRSNKHYVGLPAGLPRLGASSGFTVTAWIRTTDRTQAGQRIIIDDEGSGGFIVSLGDRGAGMVNFFSRTFNTGSELTTGAVVNNNTWYFVAATVNMATKTKALYVYDTAGTQLSASTAAFTASVFNTSTGVVSVGGETNGSSENTADYGFSGLIDEVRVHENALSTTELDVLRAMTRSCPTYGPERLQIEHDGSALTCTPETVTVKACANPACSSLYTSSTITGTLSWSGAAAGSTAFTINSGSSSTTVSVPVTAVGAVTLATSGVVPSASSSTTCLNTSTSAASCSLGFADSGLLFDVPNHLSDAAQTVTVSAVRKSDNSAACAPAFASVSRNVTFTCSYTNPGTGTLPVRVGGTALNAANSTAAACDGGGRAVSLSFNAGGVATTTVQYADAGQVTLSGTYTGSGADAGLTMSGSDSFIAVPSSFGFSSITPGPIRAGVDFSATVTARNASGNPTPNFGREGTPPTVSLSFTKATPVAGSAGSFSGSLGSFTSGAATASNLRWTEVGTGDLSASVSNYLATGTGISGSTGTGGAVGSFIPNHFDVLVTHACSAGSFTYSGQPMAVTVLARNQAGSTTTNYSGALAQSVTLSDAAGAAGGSLSGHTIASGAFTSGLASATPTYTFTAKQTAPRTLSLRASNGLSGASLVSSAGQLEGSTAVRSGRLRLSNAFGKAGASLQVALFTEYWSGNAWVTHTDDSCTALVPANLAITNARSSTGAVSAATTSATIGAFSGGQATLTLAAPSPAGSSVSYDLAFNLGSTAADQACTASHPATTGAARPWLRSANGSCSALWDRDPSGRATFGIFSPESRRTVHVRELF